MSDQPLRIAADIGGTFTDIALEREDGSIATEKRLSTPGNYADAVLRGTERLLASEGLEPARIAEVLHGCTVATNAILEQKGARTALITTEGFRDVLELRRVRTPRLYDPLWQKPEPLVPRHLRFEVRERTAPDGSVVTGLDERTLDAAMDVIEAADVEAVAVCLINSFANPEHEVLIAERLRARFPTKFVSVSAEVLPQIREYERTSTTVINAYVGPPVKAYVASLIEQLSAAGVNGRVLIMQSSGGVLAAHAVLDKPAQIIECGPAAGVIGARHVGREQGYENLITFDMGGTTAKASVIENGELSNSEEYEVGASMSATSALMAGAGYALKLPVIDISEVGAGGGSIVRIDKGGAIKVGPDSAGADPGPACYALGGTRPTVTDANVLLGYLNPEALAGGAVPIDRGRAEQAVRAEVAEPLGRGLLETAYGIHQVANTNMMRAVKAVTTHRGRDTRDFRMLAFGGSGGVHAVTLARELRIAEIVVPPAAGVFSALGLLYSDLELNEARACLRPLSSLEDWDPEPTYQALSAVLSDRLEHPPEAIVFRRFADLRYQGQAFEITIPWPDRAERAGVVEALSRRFDVEHERRYGHCFEGQYGAEVVNLRLVGTVRRPRSEGVAAEVEVIKDGPSGERMAYFGADVGSVVTPVYSRLGLGGDPRPGPLIIEEYEGTTVVPPRASALVDAAANIVIRLEGL